MIPDLNWWGRLFGLLAVEAALIVAVAALLASWTGRPQVRRVVWQGCLIAVALVWLGELAGLRGQLAKLRPARPAERTLAVRLLDAQASEPVAEPLPLEALSSLPPVIAPSRPVWWPGWLWLAGLTALAGRLVLTRAGLAWCVFKTRRERAGPSLREHGSNGGARRRASVLECVRLAAAFVRRMRTRKVTAFVHSSKAVAPLRCATALQDARALLPASSSAFALLEPLGTEAIVAQLRRRLGLGPVRVQIWPQLRGPVAFGIFRPTVALPADFADRFTPQQREAMLAHELAHLAGRDPLWLALADIVCALAWWHPAVWWARRQFRAASEAAADEASALVPGGRAALAESLVAFGRELTSPGPARGLGVSGSGLKSELARRVTTLLGPHREWRRLHPLGRWGGHGLAVLASAALALLPVSLAGLGTAPLATLAQAVQKTVKQADQGSGSEASGEVAQGTTTGTESPLENQPGAEKSKVPDAATGIYGFSEAVRVTALARELSHRLKRPVTADEASLQQALAAYLTTADFGSVPTQDLLPFRSQLVDAAGDYAWLSVYGGFGKEHTWQAQSAFQQVLKELFQAADSWPIQETVSADLLAEVETELAALPDRIEETRERVFSLIPRIKAGQTELRGDSSAAKSKLDSLLRRHMTLSKQAEFLREQLQANPPTEEPPIITLTIHFAEIAEGGGDDIGLDWLFGQSPTNNPALQSGLATTLLTQTNAPKGQNVRVDLLRSEGQSATLTAAQFAALRARLESRAGVDFLTAPKVTTGSGQQAQVAVSEVRTLVTGVQATNGTAPVSAGVNYLTEPVPVGPMVDVTPTLDGAAWRIRINASLTEFLGYDDPGGEASVSAPGAKPVTYLQPLPRLRVRVLEAAPLAESGETVALRGPLVVDTKKTKGGLFRRERTETTRKRLYVFVTHE